MPVLVACVQSQSGQAFLPTPDGSAHAWVTFDHSKLIESGASGLADRSEGRALTIDDPARIASVSKLVVALGAMRLVEQGILDLDEDVSAKLGWRLRNPHFRDRPITLRMLLSHQSSIGDEIDYAIPFGRTLRNALADPAAFDARYSPGTRFRYANLNFPVIASIMEKATGERFDHLMERLVLKPLMLDACFNWTTCSDAAIARAVVLHGPDGTVLRDDLGGRTPDCPVLTSVEVGCELGRYVPGENGALFSPQGGLRISVRDLAEIGQLLLNQGGYRGQAFLSAQTIDSIFFPAWHFDGSNGETEEGFYCAYGLAAQILPVKQLGCRDDLFGNGRRMVGHAGDAYGLRSGLWLDRERGVGIAYFAANQGEDPPRGGTAYRAIEEWLAAKLEQSGIAMKHDQTLTREERKFPAGSCSARSDC